MPYSGPDDDKLPDNVKKLPVKKRKQWIHVWDSVMEKHGDESKAFAAANSTVKKSSKGLIMDLWSVDSRQVTKEEVNYNPVGGNNDKACANCQFFIPADDACLVVAGDILPTGKSDLWMEIQKYTPEPMPVVIVDKAYGYENGFLARLKAMLGLEKPKPLMLFKAADGRLRFFLTVTNNFKDRHNEILSEAAHKEYVEWVWASGQFAPVLLWHTKGTEWGQTDWVDYADGFLVASGLVLPGKEEVAHKLASQDTAVSHGFVGAFTKSGLVTKYRSFEYSALPRAFAANYWTNYNLASKGEDLFMPFSEQRKKWLKETSGLSDEAIGSLEVANEALASSLKSMGVEYKSEDLLDATTMMKAVADVATAVAGIQQSLDTKIKELGEQLKADAAKQVEAGVASAIEARNKGVNGFSPSTAENTKVEEGKKEAGVPSDHVFFGKIMGGLDTPPQS